MSRKIQLKDLIHHHISKKKIEVLLNIIEINEKFCVVWIKKKKTTKKDNKLFCTKVYASYT